MFDLTPLVEPLSIDEAFLDLTGTERLHGMSAAKVLARFAAQVERELGITVSIGLSANKFLAKIASDLDKPRGFAVLGQSEAAAFLGSRPVGFIYGVGAVSAAKLAADGYRTIADLQRADKHDLMRRYGEEGARLAQLARRHRRAQGRSRARNQEHLGGNHLRDRHRRLPPARTDAMDAHRKGLLPAQGARLRRLHRHAQAQERRFQAAHPRAGLERSDPARHPHLRRRPRAPAREIGATRFRLIGIGVSNLEDTDGNDLADLLDRRAAEAEHAVDRLRAKFGKGAVVKGLALEDE